MSDKPTLTSESGAPVADNQNSQTAGPGGPTLLQDHYLIEKLARFNRERIPERVVHAVGTGAYGYLEATSPDVPKWTKMRAFERVGKTTEMFIRFSTVAASRGGPDVARDPRGFAMKYYTEDGNWDLVGNNTPVFFIRDGIKFPDFIHSQKQDPFTNRQEPDNVWDFFSHSPEATHQFTWLFGDRGIPASYRCMDGFGSHAFQWINAKNARFWVKFHFKTDQGIRTLTSEEAAIVGGEDPLHCHKDLHDAIEKDHLPSWTLKVQVMPEADAAPYRIDPFDLTKVWNYRDYPLMPIGKLVLRSRTGGVRSVPLRAGHRPIARSHAAGAAIRLRRRTPLPPRHQPYAPWRQRTERRQRRRAQLRAGRRHALRCAPWPREELRAKLVQRAGANQRGDLFWAAAERTQRTLSAGAARGRRLQAGRRSLSATAEGRAAAAHRQHRRQSRPSLARGHHRPLRRTLP